MWFLLSSFLVKIIVTKDSMEHGSLNSISFFIQFFYYCKRCVTFKLFGIKKFGDWFLHLLDAKAFPVNQLRILGFAPFTSHTSSFFFFSVLTEEVHARYKDIIQSEYDRVIDQCMEEVNRVKVC